MIYSAHAQRVAAILIALAATSCGPTPPAPAGTPGSVVIHMGGSINSFGGVSSSR